MTELLQIDFSYGIVRRLLAERSYDQAIALLSERVDAQPEDRTARLMLLLANVSVFGPDAFYRQIDDLRFIVDLSANERSIVRQIFSVGFQYAERDRKTIQKISYQRLIRRLMLGQPLDVSIRDARQTEASNARSGTGEALEVSEPLALSNPMATTPTAPLTPRPINHWDEYLLIAVGVMILIALVAIRGSSPRQESLAHNQIPAHRATVKPGVPSALASEDRLAPRIDAPGTKAFGTRELISASIDTNSQTEIARAGALKHAPRYAAQTIEKVDRGTRVTVLQKERDWIKVQVQPSGNIGYLRMESLSAFNNRQ